MQRVASPRASELSIPRPVVSTLLCAGLMAATSWAVLAGGWAQNAGGAVVVAVAAAVEAGLLARAGVPRWLPLVLGPILALAAIVPTTLGAMPFDGNPTTTHTIERYVSGIFKGLGSNTDWSFTVGLCAVLWLCGYWVGWMAMRERRGVLAVLPVYAILATNVLNTRFVNNVALPEAVAVCFTLLVIADAHLDRLHARWATANVASLPGTRSRFAASVAVISLLLTLAALLLPPISSADISSRFFNGGGGKAGGAGGDVSTPSDSGTIEFNGTTQPGGPLVSVPRQVLVYTTDASSTVYLRVVDDVIFQGGNWYPDHVGAFDGADQWLGVPYAGGNLPRDALAADGATVQAIKTVRAQIVMQAKATGVTSLTPVMGEPVSVDQAGIAFGTATPDDSHLLTVDSVELDTSIDTGTTVGTVGTVSIATADQLRSAGTDYPDWVTRYTTWSDDATGGGAIVQRLARQWTQGLTNPYDMATAIESRLRLPSQFRYTLSPPRAPANEWPIVLFLTQSHRGYCQYFAASMGLMLRTLGIPTRLVNGYGPGVSQEQSGKPGVHQQLVTTSDAHTWVEAYFPKYGWIPFEPTPSSSDGNYVPFVRGPSAGVAPPTGAALPTPSTIKPGFNDANQALGGPVPVAAKGISAGLVLGAVAGSLLVAALGFVAWLALPRSLRGAWLRLEVVGRLCGLRRRPSETYREYSLRLARVQPRMDAPLAELSAQLGRARYSRDVVDRAAVRRALVSWRRALRVAPLLARTLRRREMQPA